MNISNLWTPQWERPDGSKRYTWGETSSGFSLPRITVTDWHEECSTLVLGLGVISLYINLPKLRPVHGIDQGGYGFYFSDDALVLEWGKRSKFLYYPWSWSFHKHWELAGAWNRVIWVEIPRALPSGRVAQKWSAPYTYTLRNGTVQERIATYYVERREWRWLWLKWLPWPRMVKTSISVSFSDEVGEGSGSWKGGTLGCGYDMKRGELPVETLRRMERERIFK